MDKLFLQVLNMSITSSYVILFVIVIRVFLKKAPKIFSYGLWGIAFLRLIFPFSFESIFSLISINTNTIPENIAYTQQPQIQSGIMAIDSTINRILPSPLAEASVNPMQIWISLGSVIWVIGFLILLFYSVFTTFRLKKNLKSASSLYENIYEMDTIKTPFVFGLIKPKIVLPNNLFETEKSYIIEHEQTHIKRKDHIIKFLAFLIVSVHWFNPFTWLAFYLMGEDMELSCDESVIEKMGSEIKRDYSSSLLSLSIGKRIIGGSPLAFGENNTKGRIKNILSYKKPKLWVLAAAIIIITGMAVGLLSSPPQEKGTVKDYAWEYIDAEIEMYENAELEAFKIIDKKITKLERVSSFDNILSSPVELWRLEYRLKPDHPEAVMLAGGMDMEDGWLTEASSMGKPTLVFTYDKNALVYLGNIPSQDRFGLETLASQEIGIRDLLESKGLLENETYKGNHVVIKFLLSTGETSQLLLSQPVKQGKSGIWTVERWMDGNGSIYHDVPSFEEDIKLEDYYKDLQEQADNGNKPGLLNPIEVGYDYIMNTLGQVMVKRKDLVIIDPATINDFLTTPESHYIGYITKMTLEENLFHLDRIEFLTLKDEKRAAELGIDINTDMPSGFYIYNKNTYPTALDVTDETEYLILKVDGSGVSSGLTSLTKKEFIQHKDLLSFHPLYHVYTKDGYVTRIEQQYLP